VKTLPVRFTRSAQTDVDTIHEGVLEKSRSLATADGFIARLVERCARIGDVPRGAPLRDEIRPGIRIVFFEKSWAIAYFVEKTEVIITNVFYAGRDYAALLRGEPPGGEN
jgi:toxin ParE1/3/4